MWGSHPPRAVADPAPRSAANPMSITANGKAFEIEDNVSVAEFIRRRGLDPRYVVVERNGEPLERHRYEEVLLLHGDRLELVRAVAGGR
jgi:sulfur carrier protein